jgi:hypothetical protein
MAARNIVLQVRVTEIESGRVQMAAKAQGMKVADFIRVRILGELPESSHTEALPDPDPRVLGNPGAKISDLKARLGLKTGAELLGGEVAKPPAVAQPAPKPRQMCNEDGSDIPAPRKFNPRRPDWYTLVKRSDVYECVQDNETGQYFVQQGGRGREFPTLKAALEYCDSIDFA